MKGYLSPIFFGAIFGGLFHYLGKKYGFFKPLLLEKEEKWFKTPHFLLLICLYFLITQWFAPFLFKIIFLFIYQRFPLKIFKEPVVQIALFQLFIFIFICIVFLWIAFRWKNIPLKKIWKDKDYVYSSTLFTNIFLGIIAFVIALPVIICANQLSELATYLIFHVKEIEQVAVKYLKMSMQYPPFFSIYLIGVLFFAPLVEEFFFRGCLQSYLRSYLGSKASILLSAFLFSLFHFSAQQGIGNFSILFTLFIFALYLGYLYERQRALISSIALHMTFNAISVIRIIYTE